MSCEDNLARIIADSMRAAEAVYSANKEAKIHFIVRDDAEAGLDVVDDMLMGLSAWEADVRRLKDAAWSCGKKMS